MFQKITIVGNLGNDPEMRYLPDGTAVTNLSVATNRRWTDGNGQPTEETTWFRVSVWGKQAEATNQYLTRGRQVLVEGRLVPDPDTGGPRTFERRDGSTGAAFEIRALNITFLGGNDRSSNGNPASDSAQPAEEDEIPF